MRAPAPAMARARFGDGLATTAVEGAANCPCRKDPGRSQRWEMVQSVVPDMEGAGPCLRVQSSVSRDFYAIASSADLQQRVGTRLKLLSATPLKPRPVSLACA